VFLIAFFGALMMLLSAMMVADPEYWSKGVVKFSRWAWFHPFEIVSRILFGVSFVFFADQTRFPGLMSVIGYVLLAVGVGLLLMPPSKHREFAEWSAGRFKSVFRPAGLVSFFFGLFLVIAALG
jgi:hypothetical protein